MSDFTVKFHAAAAFALFALFSASGNLCLSAELDDEAAPVGQITDYDALTDTVELTGPRDVNEDGLGEPVAIPEPSAFALIGCLGLLLLAMTLLRWHFDRSIVVATVAERGPQATA